MREKVKGGVVLKTLSGEIEVSTNDLKFMDRINEMHKGNYNKDTIHKMHSGNFDNKLIDEFDSREIDIERNDPEAWKKLQAQKKTQIVNEPPQLGVIAHKGRGGEELKKYSIDEDDMTIDETEGENSVRKNYVMLNRRPDFQKLSDSYRELLKLNSNFRNNSEFQNVLSSLRDAIAKYFNENNVSVTPEDVQNYYTNWSKRKKYQSADAIMEYKPINVGEKESEVEKENPMLYPDGWKEMDGMFMNPNNPMYKKMHGIEDEMTDELLGYKSINVGENYDFATAEREYADKDAMNKYIEYTRKDFDSLSDDDKEEFFQLWKQFKDVDKMNEETGAQKYSIVEKTVYGMTHLFAFPDEQGVETEEGLNNWEMKDSANRELHFVNNREEAVGSLKAFGESKEAKPVITEQEIKTARQALNKRGLTEGMTKKEAVQLLIKHNIKH